MIGSGSKVLCSNNNVDWHEGILEDILLSLDRPYSVRVVCNGRVYGFMYIKLVEE